MYRYRGTQRTKFEGALRLGLKNKGRYYICKIVKVLINFSDQSDKNNTFNGFIRYRRTGNFSKNYPSYQSS